MVESNEVSHSIPGYDRSAYKAPRTDISSDPPPQPTASTAHADPEEVDISQHYYEPSKTARARNNAAPAPAPPQQQQLNDQQLRQMMLGFDPASTPTPASNPFAGPGMAAAGAGAGAEDPMMKMLQQMLGGAAGGGADGMPAFAGMPNAAGPTTTTAAAAAADPYAYLWRIIHAVFALGFGLYIAFTTQFTGSRADRESSSGLAAAYISEDGTGRSGVTPASVHFFWVFATAEVLLQTSRFFVEKGRVQSNGMLGMVAGFLPEPYKGYVALVMRYSRIWTTISADAMALVFVLGVCAWWRGT